MIPRRRPRRAFAMAMMLVVLMVLTVITATLVGTASSDRQSSRLAAGRSEARLLAESVFEDFFSRLKEDPTGLYDLLGSNETDGLAGSVFAGYNTAFRRTTAPKWALLPSSGRVGSPPQVGPVGSQACGDDLLEDCFHLQIEERLGNPTSPGSFLLRVNLRLRCGGVEARCVFASFEQRVRRVQFYDFALANEFTTLAPDALFPLGSFDGGGLNKDAYQGYVEACAKRGSERDSRYVFDVHTGATDFASGAFEGDGFEPLEFEGCLDVAYTSDTAAGGLDKLNNASIYAKDDFISVCGAPGIKSVFLSGQGLPADSGDVWSDGRTGFSAPSGCPSPPPRPAIGELGVPVLSLPSGSDVLAATAPATPTRLTSGTPEVINLSGRSGLLVYEGDGIASTLDAVVYGEVSGKLSLVVEGSVAIIGDVTYRNGTVNNSSDSFSLTASDRIEIWQSCLADTRSPADPAGFPSWPTDRSCVPSGPFDRTVHGVLTSPNGYIGVPDWLSNLDIIPETDREQGTLFFYGSMTSKFQGVFGGFSTASGAPELVSGFFKDFTHDDRFTTASRTANGADVLPPYLVESSAPVWVRLDVSEVPYRE